MTEMNKPFNIVEQIQRRSVIQSLDSLSKFDAEELVGNVYGIKKLNDEKVIAVAQNFFLQDRIEQLEISNQRLEVENQKLKTELKQISGRGLPLLLASLLATIVIAIGVNVVTSDSNQSLGILLIVLALLCELIVFLLRPKGN